MFLAFQRATLILKGNLIMGEIIIKIPQPVRREFQIDDEEFVRHIVASLEAATSYPAHPSANELEEVVGIWTDREGIEDPVEFARKLRKEAWTRS
jgi:hypothetical protein